MAKTALEQWDETNANNTDVGAINIDEGCAPSGINNALREHMSQTAKWLGDDTLASATTTDLGSVPGRYVSVTGTTTITGFGTIKAGTVKYVKFTGALILTHNATSLILPGAANITTVAGNMGIFVSEGSGNWRCVSFTRNVAPLGLTGTVVQAVYGQYSSSVDISTILPFDASIPQNTEGTEIIVVAITPLSTTNRLRVRLSGMGTATAATYMSAALFTNSTANAIAAKGVYTASAGHTQTIELQAEWVPGSVSEQTIRIRVGPASDTMRLNGVHTGGIFGGIATTSLIVEEIQAS